MNPALQEAFDSYARVLAAKPAEWCQLHPGNDDRCWSAQGVVEHLALVLRSTSRLLATRLERGRPTQNRATVSERARQILILSFGRMPRGAQAPSFARPGHLAWRPLSGSELLASLRLEIDQMDRLLDDCRDRFGTQRTATHFLLGPMRADQWRKFHAIHLRHHLRQLHRIEREVSAADPAPAPENAR
jgi:hypothetical protein